MFYLFSNRSPHKEKEKEKDGRKKEKISRLLNNGFELIDLKRMMYKFLITLSVCLVLILSACSQKTNCEQLPTKFSSYKEASNKIKEANFKLFDKVNTLKSSWINGASYYSCDGTIGYFILLAKGKEYIHKGVPKSVWIAFKNSESFGSYYNKNIRDKYILYINQ